MPRQIGSILVYRLATSVMATYFRVHGGIRAVGLENVPQRGGVILASVHMSHLDSTAMAATCRPRRLLAMAKEELWRNRAFGWLIGQIGAFPVRRGEGDTEAMRLTIELLSQGEAMIIFPEGTRNDGQTMLPLERGVAVFAKKSGVPVVPVGIHGTQRLMPRGGAGKVGRHLTTVVYGPSFTYADVATGAGEKENREIFTTALAERIATACAQAGNPIKSGY